MTGDVVNLRRARKAKARDDRDGRAAENRARCGLTLAERRAQAAADTKAARDHDGHRLCGVATGDEA